MTKFKYGDSWEKYPIKEGEVWADAATGSMVSVCDITSGLPSWMTRADMIYCDPPWNLGNVNSFYTKAGRTDYKDHFREFYGALFSQIRRIAPTVCYLEIGKQNLSVFQSELQTIFRVVQEWPITYYKKNPCFLLRGGPSLQSFDFAGMDEADTPFEAIKNESVGIVADLCTGQGLTAVAAYRNERGFVGTELNPRRLAVAIDRVNKLGGNYACTVSEGHIKGDD